MSTNKPEGPPEEVKVMAQTEETAATVKDTVESLQGQPDTVGAETPPNEVPAPEAPATPEAQPPAEIPSSPPPDEVQAQQPVSAPEVVTEAQPAQQTEWWVLTRTTDDPKLAWLQVKLQDMGIPSKRVGLAWDGPILVVPKDKLFEAWAFLNTVVGLVSIENHETEIAIFDLPDDHPYFVTQFETLAGKGRIGFDEDGSFKGDIISVGTVKDITDALQEAEPFEWTDSIAVPGEALRDSLQPLKYVTEKITGVGQVTFIDLGRNGIESSHVSAVGAQMQREGNGKVTARIFVRYKGGILYSYQEYTPDEWFNLVACARRMAQGDVNTLTVGEYIERVIKAKHEDGKARCVKQEKDGTWVKVLTKAEKQAQGITSKPKSGGKGTGKKKLTMATPPPPITRLRLPAEDAVAAQPAPTTEFVMPPVSKVTAPISSAPIAVFGAQKLGQQTPQTAEPEEFDADKF